MELEIKVGESGGAGALNGRITKDTRERRKEGVLA